jgi:hypothetical protein
MAARTRVEIPSFNEDLRDVAMRKFLENEIISSKASA